MPDVSASACCRPKRCSVHRTIFSMSDTAALVSRTCHDPAERSIRCRLLTGDLVHHTPEIPTELCRVVELVVPPGRSEEHTSELQSLVRISYAVFCLKKKKT